MSKSRWPRLLTLLLPIFLLACESGPNRHAEPSHDIDSLVARVSTLEEQSPSAVVLIPGSGTYEVLHMDLGTLVLTLDTIEATTSGTRIRLRIGNTTSATIEDIDATVFWGPLSVDSIPQVAGNRSKEVEFPGRFRSGAWTPVTVELGGVNPAAIGFLRVAAMSHRGLELK